MKGFTAHFQMFRKLFPQLLICNYPNNILVCTSLTLTAGAWNILVQGKKILIFLRLYSEKYKYLFLKEHCFKKKKLALGRYMCSNEHTFKCYISKCSSIQPEISSIVLSLGFFFLCGVNLLVKIEITEKYRWTNICAAIQAHVSRNMYMFVYIYKQLARQVICFFGVLNS